MHKRQVIRAKGLSIILTLYRIGNKPAVSRLRTGCIGRTWLAWRAIRTDLITSSGPLAHVVSHSSGSEGFRIVDWFFPKATPLNLKASL